MIGCYLIVIERLAVFFRSIDVDDQKLAVRLKAGGN